MKPHTDPEKESEQLPNDLVEQLGKKAGIGPNLSKAAIAEIVKWLDKRNPWGEEESAEMEGWDSALGLLEKNLG